MFHGLLVRPRPPLDRTPFHFANRALVTSGHPLNAENALGFRLRLGGGRCASAAIRYALLSGLRSTGSFAPLADTQTEAQAITNRSCMADTRSRPELADTLQNHTNRTRNNVRV